MSAKDCIFTQARLKELLHYDPKTGVFTWRVTKSNRAMKGSVAGYESNRGYIQIGIEHVLHFAHRLAFLYMTGSMPEQVDHGNGVRDDNRWKNLSPATSSTNSKNTKLSSHNTSGVCGVFWYKRHQKWVANIRVGRAYRHLGYFTEFDDAVRARKRAEKKYGFHKNHGKSQRERSSS